MTQYIRFFGQRLFSLDIEGAEIQVLENIPFDQIDIKVISIESNHLGQIFSGSVKRLNKLMKKNGYIFWKTVEIDDIYVKKEFFKQLKDEL